MGDVSQSDLCWREQEFACRTVRESLDDGRELFERKGCTGCERFGGSEIRKMMNIRKRPDAFDKAFVGKLVDVV